MAYKDESDECWGRLFLCQANFSNINEVARVQSSLKLVKVFLGSPSDLIQERERFRSIVEEVNKWANLMGIRFVPVSGEDVLHDIGHPQELINEGIIKECEIFVLLLWKWWGTPTQKYTSGFEEEYEVAKSLKKKNRKVKIWLYLRDIASDMLADPGKQLRKVLAFRKKIEKECLYVPYKDEDQWEQLLQQDLRDWLNQPRILKRTEMRAIRRKK